MKKISKILPSTLDEFCLNKSIVLAAMFFKRFDNGSIVHKRLNYRIINFDKKKGSFVDVIWGKKNKAYIIRVVRDKNNKMFSFRKRDYIKRFYINLLCLIANITFFLKFKKKT